MYEISYTSVFPELSKYQKFILNKIIADIAVNKDFSISGLVKKAVSQKCILQDQNALVSETGNVLKEYLLAHGMVIEKEEMTAYLLTEKGRELIESHTIEQFEKKELRKNKPSVIHQLFHGDPNKKEKPASKIREDIISYYE